MNEYCEGLKAEIRFWRELISESDLSLHSPECKRMEKALQLAQARLSECEIQLNHTVEVIREH